MEFIMVGFGAVAYGLLEVFNKEKLYLQNKFTIIEPRDKKKEIDFLFHSRNATSANATSANATSAKPY